MSQGGALALLTGVFTLGSLILFIRGALKGRARPYLWAWAIRTVICAVAFLSQLDQGATYSLALAGSQILCCIAIIGFVLCTGPVAGKLDKIDWLTLAIAGLGVVGWVVSGESLFSIVGVIVADTCATAMSVRAAITKGSRESIAFWLCTLGAASMALLAARDASWAIIVMPAFSCLNAGVNILTASYLHRRVSVQDQLVPVPIGADD